MKTLMACMLFAVALVAPAQAQTVNPGCLFSWSEPLVTNPANPTGPKIGAWVLAGDLDGFQWVTNNTLTWDPMKMQLIDKVDRTVPCSTVSVETPGPYFVMIKAYDTSGNASPFAVLSFSVALEDSDEPAAVMEVCVEGTLLGKPARLCAMFDAL